MEPDFPPNRRDRDQRDESRGPRPETRRVQQVVQSPVIRRRRPLSKRLAETFVGGDARSVWDYLVGDVMVPALKDTVSDVFSEGIERVLFGESKRSRRGGSHRPGAASHVNYGGYSSQRSSRRDEPRQISRQARARHNFDEIILPTRVEAEEVMSMLFELISKYESATVADLYNLVGVQEHFTDSKWGWTDIRGAGVVRLRGGSGYLLDLPQPESLD